MTADHLCINVLKYVPVYEEPYSKVLLKWRDSSSFWERRLSIVAYIKHFKGNLSAQQQALSNISFLMQDKSYYVRKAIPWVLRTISKVNPALIQEFLLGNYMFFRITELKEASKFLSEPVKTRLIQQGSKTKGREDV